MRQKQRVMLAWLCCQHHHWPEALLLQMLLHWAGSAERDLAMLEAVTGCQAQVAGH